MHGFSIMLAITMNQLIVLIVAWSNPLGALQQMPEQRKVSFPVASPAQNEMTFKPVGHFSGRRSSGARFAINFYKSSDGVGISQTVEIYQSGARARAEFERQIKRASKVIERMAERDQDSRLNGQKAVLLFSEVRSRKAHATVVRVVGVELYLVESTSLPHALEFSSR